MDEQWYQNLLQECKEIVTEGIFTSNWTLVETYHSLGARITKDRDNLKKKSVTVTQMAKDLGKSKRTIQRSIQFYQKFPDLNLLPEGKNINWNRLVNKYLPEPKSVTVTFSETNEDLTFTEVKKIAKQYIDNFEPDQQFVEIKIRQGGEKWSIKLNSDHKVKKGRIIKSVCPNKVEGHKGCLEFISSFATSRNVKFPNYAKQILAVHKMIGAGYNWDQINKQIDKMEANKFWKEQGFDLMTVAMQIGKGGGK